MKFFLNIEKNRQSKVWAYECFNLSYYDVIFETFWLYDQQISVILKCFLSFWISTLLCHSFYLSWMFFFVFVAFFALLTQTHQKRFKRNQVFFASMTNIEKTLKLKVKKNSKNKLFKQYHQYLNVFNWKTAKQMSSHRDEEMNHQIEFQMNENEKISNFSWDLLYNMIRDELLVFRKTLTN